METGPRLRRYSLSKDEKIIRKAFTLIELMIVFCLLAIVVVIGTCIATRVQKSYVSKDYAQEFSKQLDGVVTGTDCVDRDTDGDGYVTCTVFRKDKDPLSILCAAKWSLNKGCKMALPRILNQ